MARRLLLPTLVMVILVLPMAACRPNPLAESEPSPVQTVIITVEAPDKPGEADPDPAGRGAIYNRVIEHGRLVCGSRTDLLGFGYLDDSGRNVGFDIDMCRAIAAAVLGDPEALEVVPLSASDRGPALQTAEVDVLSRNVTWTSSRDAQWGNFAVVTFYDGQTFMVPAGSGIETIEDMQGATISVTGGSTTEKNLADAFRQRGLEYEALIFDETAPVFDAYEQGRADVTTGDVSQLYAVREGFADPGAHTILPFTISKEPLSLVVPHGDDQWLDIVKIVFFGLVNAEEYGVTQANVEEMKSSESINVRRLLGQEDDWGYSDLGLEADSLAAAIAAVGNYGEIYDRYFGPHGLAFPLPRGANDLWTNGGLIFAPEIK